MEGGDWELGTVRRALLTGRGAAMRCAYRLVNTSGEVVAAVVNAAMQRVPA